MKNELQSAAWGGGELPISRSDIDLFVRHLFQNPFATVLQKIEHEFESFATFVIWVGDMAPLRMAAAELREPIQFVEIAAFGRESRHGFVIHIVHDHYHVEIDEILLGYLSCAMRQIVSASRRRRAHARIGQLACVAAVCAGRIDGDLI